MKNKKIYIDGFSLVEDHFSGIGHYVLGILRGLDEIIDEKKIKGEETPEIIVFTPYDRKSKYQKYGFKHFRHKNFPMAHRTMGVLWHRGKLPPVDIFLGRGHYLFTRFVSMPLLFSKSSVIVYDLSYELHREYADEKNAEFLSNQVKRTLYDNVNVFVISNSVKNEVKDFYGIHENRIFVSTPAVDQKQFYRRGSVEVDDKKHKYGITGEYILALSNLEPRKNLDSLVDAYCSLPKKITNKYSLLLVGVSGWKTDELFKKIIGKVEDGYNIIRPSKYVKDGDLPAIISGASLLVYPSHYEGFGIPPLEALACGTPVISANNSSLPEAVGDAAIMVEDNSAKNLSKTIKGIVENLDVYKKRTTAEGPAHADSFSWKKSAQVYWDVVVGEK